mgnify:CR=1 FL=1
MYKEVTERIKLEAQRLGVYFEVKSLPHKPGVKGMFVPSSNKITLVPGCLEETICHEVIHFLQIRYSFYLFGQDEKDELSKDKKYVNLWGHFFSEREVVQTASAIMDHYPQVAVPYEIAAYLLQDRPEEVLDILVSL